MTTDAPLYHADTPEPEDVEEVERLRDRVDVLAKRLREAREIVLGVAGLQVVEIYRHDPPCSQPCCDAFVARRAFASAQLVGAAKRWIVNEPAPATPRRRQGDQ